MMVRGAVVLLSMIGVAGAAHADEATARPVAAAIEGLRDCPGGGFVLPGSKTCLRLGGQVSASTVLRSGSASKAAPGLKLGRVATHVDARLSADVRIDTEAGPLRAYTSLRVRDPAWGGAAR